MDADLALLINSLAGRSVAMDTTIMFFASYLAYLLIACALLSVAYALYKKREAWEAFFVALTAVIISRGVITELIRFFYHRRRPFSDLPVHELFTTTAWSFPSGHAAFFFSLATALYLYDRRWGIAFFAGALLIGFARVAAGVHYPLDVAGGAGIGLFSALLAQKLVRLFTPKNRI